MAQKKFFQRGTATPIKDETVGYLKRVAQIKGARREARKN